MEEIQKEIKEDEEFNCIIEDLLTNDTVQQMNEYRQHYTTSCFQHCLNVSFYSYVLCKKLGLDYKAAARAGMLHDLFLYDWRKRENGRKGLHAFTHPKTAFENASRLFELSKKEQDIIVKHMWPLTLVPPKYKESYIISLVDKYCAMQESASNYKKIWRTSKFPRYAYVFLTLLVFKIM